MRIPRDVSGDELANLLGRLGYRISRQTGRHMRLTTLREGEHHITIDTYVSELVLAEIDDTANARIVNTVNDALGHPEIQIITPASNKLALLEWFPQTILPQLIKPEVEKHRFPKIVEFVIEIFHEPLLDTSL